MGRKYVAMFDGVAVSAIAELFYIEAPATAVVALHEVVVTQDTSETSEMLPIRIFRTATDQSGKGTDITPTPLEVGDAAFAGDVCINILTGATFATPGVVLSRQAQNALGGWHWLWTPETRPIIPPSGKVVVKLETAPAASLTISGYAVFEEIG